MFFPSARIPNTSLKHYHHQHQHHYQLWAIYTFWIHQMIHHFQIMRPTKEHKKLHNCKLLFLLCSKLYKEMKYLGEKQIMNFLTLGEEYRIYGYVATLNKWYLTPSLRALLYALSLALWIKHRIWLPLWCKLCRLWNRVSIGNKISLFRKPEPTSQKWNVSKSLLI